MELGIFHHYTAVVTGGRGSPLESYSGGDICILAHFKSNVQESRGNYAVQNQKHSKLHAAQFHRGEVRSLTEHQLVGSLRTRLL